MADAREALSRASVFLAGELWRGGVWLLTMLCKPIFRGEGDGGGPISGLEAALAVSALSYTPQGITLQVFFWCKGGCSTEFGSNFLFYVELSDAGEVEEVGGFHLGVPFGDFTW